MFLSFLLLLLVFYLRLMIAQVMCVRWNVFFEACFIDRVKEWCSFLKGRNTRSVALRKKNETIWLNYPIVIIFRLSVIHSWYTAQQWIQLYPLLHDCDDFIDQQKKNYERRMDEPQKRNRKWKRKKNTKKKHVNWNIQKNITYASCSIE